MKMSFHSHADKTHFHMKGFARGLALKKRQKTIRKWPIGNICYPDMAGLLSLVLTSLRTHKQRNYLQWKF